MFEEMTEQQAREQILEMTRNYCEKYHNKKKPYQKGDRIPYASRVYDAEEMVNLVDSSLEFWLTAGRYTDEFEHAFAKYLGVRYCSLVNSGSSANLLAFMTLTSPLLKERQILPGDEVITTPLTFAASSNCVLYCGGTPVFADVDPKTYNIDPEDIKRKITGKTKAIIPVHLAGQPCDMDEIHAIAKEHHLIVIEDAAHALGSEYKGKMIGSMSDMTTFSFHPVKPITTGEGGMIVTNDETLYKKLVLFRSHGITRDESQMTCNEGPWFYQQIIQRSRQS